MALTPTLFRSLKADGADITLLRPSNWNAVVDLLTRVLDGVDAAGSLLVRDASVNGAGWLADVAVGSVLASGGTTAAPAYTASPSLTGLTLSGTATVPIVAGGTAASSTLILESTSGAGTTDAIIFKTGSQVEKLRITTAGLLAFGGIGAQPALKPSGSELQVRFSNDTNYTSFGTGFLTVNATQAANKCLYLTGAISHGTPSAYYQDVAMSGIGGSGATAQGMYLTPSFSLGANASGISVLGLPITTVTLNGFTVTNATTLDIDGAPTNGTNKRAVWVRAGLSQFDGALSLNAHVIVNVPAATGQLVLTNGAGTAGAGLDLATDAVLKVRTRAHTGYATVDALGYSVSGAAGASFGPAGVASITVVNGLITAIS